jgi:hypothetical protein
MNTMRVTCTICQGGHYASTCKPRPKAVAAR